MAVARACGSADSASCKWRGRDGPLPPPLSSGLHASCLGCRAPSKEGASLRAEAEAPFRSLRLFLFGAGAASAALATLFGLPSLIGALSGAPGATKSIAEALQDLAINVRLAHT